MKLKFVKVAACAALSAALGIPVSVAAPVAPHYPRAIGPGEGVLNIVAWEGYAQDEWVKPFEEQTGCTVHRRHAGCSGGRVTLVRPGGGGEVGSGPSRAVGSSLWRLLGDVERRQPRSVGVRGALRPALAGVRDAAAGLSRIHPLRPRMRGGGGHSS